jgi:hypothetical protein
MLRRCQYLVPASLVGRQVRGLLGASELVVLNGRRQVAGHQRFNRRGSNLITRVPGAELMVLHRGAPQRHPQIHRRSPWRGLDEVEVATQEMGSTGAIIKPTTPRLHDLTLAE